MKLQFYLRFHTEFGQGLWITGDSEELGNNDPAKALPMEYLNEEFWQCSLEIKRKELQKNISYKYFLKNKDGELLYEWGNDRYIDISRKNLDEVQLVDTWNHAGEYENVFFSDAFNEVLLLPNQSKGKSSNDKSYTHVFKVKAPLLRKNEIICLLGHGEKLGDWSETDPVLMKKESDWWSVKLDLADSSFPVAYKYAVYNSKEKKFLQYE